MLENFKNIIFEIPWFTCMFTLFTCSMRNWIHILYEIEFLHINKMKAGLFFVIAIGR